jgi:hypothetical protein
LRRALDTRGRRVLPIAKQPRRKMRQCRQGWRRIRAEACSGSRPRAGSGRYCRRSFPRPPPAIDEDDVAAALWQVQRDANSYHARHGNNHIGARSDLARSLSCDCAPCSAPVRQASATTVGPIDCVRLGRFASAQNTFYSDFAHVHTVLRQHSAERPC